MFKEKYPNTYFIEKVFIIKNKMMRDGLIEQWTSCEDAFLRGLIHAGAKREHNYGIIHKRIIEVLKGRVFDRTLNDIESFKLGLASY